VQVCERGEGVRVPSEDFALGNRVELIETDAGSTLHRDR
jgi:hypothetical protein